MQKLFYTFFGNEKHVPQTEFLVWKEKSQVLSLLSDSEKSSVEKILLQHKKKPVTGRK